MRYQTKSTSEHQFDANAAPRDKISMACWQDGAATSPKQPDRQTKKAKQHRKRPAGHASSSLSTRTQTHTWSLILCNQRQVSRTPPNPDLKGPVHRHHPVLPPGAPVAEVLSGQRKFHVFDLARLQLDLGEIPKHADRKFNLLTSSFVPFGHIVRK